MKSSQINISIFIIFYCIKSIISSSERIPHYGKCVYFSNNSRSQIINFYKYNNNYSQLNESFRFNLCNDTIYSIKDENGTEEIKTDSQIVYINNSANITKRITGAFNFLRNTSLKDETILTKENGEEIYI